jgi:uncharacterized phiE125 gp8 family phage protein
VVLSLEDAKAHLRVDFDADDGVIADCAAAAQATFEQRTGQVLTPRVMEMACWGFPVADYCRRSSDALEIPRAPVTAIDAVAYTDNDGQETDLDEALWRWSESAPELLRPAWATSWPTAADEAGSVRITFEAGYEDGLVPADIIRAVKLLTGHFYANREGVVVDPRAVSVELPDGIERLVSSYRVSVLA